MGKATRVWVKECPSCSALLATPALACWPLCRRCGWPEGEADNRGQSQRHHQEVVRHGATRFEGVGQQGKQAQKE